MQILKEHKAARMIQRRQYKKYGKLLKTKPTQ